MNIPILYEDEDVLVVSKPAGLVVHPDGRTKETTLVDWLHAHYPHLRGVGEPLQFSSGKALDRPGIVHRLDRETSGALLVAKNQHTYAHLKQQFQTRHVEKIYRAFVHGRVKKDEGRIDLSIGRSRKDFRRHSAKRVRGATREAETLYRVLARGRNVTLLAVYPKTGRTHQVRVHLDAIGHPILCDRLYAPARPCLFGFRRVALHAYAIAFRLPKGKLIHVVAPYPDDFEMAAAALKGAVAEGEGSW